VKTFKHLDIRVDIYWLLISCSVWSLLTVCLQVRVCDNGELSAVNCVESVVIGPVHWETMTSIQLLRHYGCRWPAWLVAGRDNEAASH